MRKLISAVSIFLVLGLFVARGAAPAEGKNGMVATVSEIASRAGVEAMKKGGNAVDAAVAAALTLGVVNGYNSGIGGGCFLLIRQATGEFVAIDGREMAPAAATPNMYFRNGKADTTLSQLGPLASGTPGALAAYDLALRKCGKLTLKQHLLDAARIAEDGFRVDKRYAGVLKDSAQDLAKFSGSRAVFLKPNGEPYVEGDILKQPDLAKTYRGVAEHGLEWFYGGPFAHRIEGWMKKNHGMLTTADFKNYHAIEREPISTDYRGYKVVSFPPPSSGGVHVIEILNMLETRDLAKMNGEVDRDQFIAEAMKLAFADRAYWLGDPDFASVPRGLISKDYAHDLAAKISLEHATEVAGHGEPPNAQTDVFKKHTTHFSTADAEGNWVACTATVNTHFGSKVVVPGTGVVLNNEMDDFSIEPGVANHFGLVGAEANAVGPGKRPLSCMTPTIILKENQPFMSVGAAGGPTIISQTLLNIVNVIDYGLDVQSAIDKPKFHQQWRPDELKVEKAMDAWVMEGLEKRGQKLNKVNILGSAQAIVRNPNGGFYGAADPRAGGKAIGW